MLENLSKWINRLGRRFYGNLLDSRRRLRLVLARLATERRKLLSSGC